jgi:hypothetical protein
MWNNLNCETYPSAKDLGVCNTTPPPDFWEM